MKCLNRCLEVNSTFLIRKKNISFTISVNGCKMKAFAWRCPFGGIFIVPYLVYDTGPRFTQSRPGDRPFKSPCTTSTELWGPILTQVSFISLLHPYKSLKIYI